MQRGREIVSRTGGSVLGVTRTIWVLSRCWEGVFGVFLRGNSSAKPTFRQLLESVQQHLAPVVASLSVILVSAPATAGHAWRVGPLLSKFRG